MPDSFICIVASHYRTPLWILSAKKVSRVMVLCRNQDDLNFALDLCDSDDMIIDLTDSHINSQAYSTNLIEDFEKKYNISLMSLVLSDRRLRTLGKDDIKTYLSYLISQFEKIDFDKISFSMSEPTWFHERLFLIYCNLKKIHSIHLRPDRYLGGCFNVFTGDDYRFLVKNRLASPSKDSINKYKNSVIGEGKPRDFDKVEKRNFFTVGKFKGLYFLLSFYRRKGGSKYIHQPLHSMLTGKVKNIIRGYYLKYFYRFDPIPRNTNVALLLLHMQPEQSIDVANWQYSDQINTARRLRERLPTNTVLCVKDHPHCAGMRGLDFYARMKELSNTHLLNPFVDTKSILGSVTSVYSASGTGAFEAGVKGVTCGCFNHVFFEGVCSSRVHLEYDGDLPSLIETSSVPRVEVDQTICNILEAQFPGDVRDMLRDKSVMSDDNIEKVSQALKQLLNDGF